MIDSRTTFSSFCWLCKEGTFVVRDQQSLGYVCNIKFTMPLFDSVQHISFSERRGFFVCMYAMQSLISRFNVLCNNIDLIHLKSLSVHTNFCETIASTHTVIMGKPSNFEIENLPRQLLKLTGFAKILHFAMFIRSGNLFMSKENLKYWITR